ncbi:phenylalanyl-tRNA synthetase beta subunit [Gulbenkiania indica]|uniref:Phenylalanine--tRNA ligase beta subunit n=1 Tax=Gulbenkiania indica TaxID=375574 RepID=A0A0K6H4J8_9NEIS|nr:phenylalanine--tRNA ligase subunit beta [Gulbenkiania indica]CUA85640.1 phenylalanyl-tRNA synthetase beta subunit [Gulbenkiania indica]
MQFSEQWLRSWVNPSLSTDELSYLLTMAGLEVEEVTAAAPAFSGVVVAEVKEVVKHENADRLRVTKVDAGTGELIQIVCGAPNVAPGLRVPCALPGAVLPGDFRIKPTKMRGVESNGMLCSGKELGVPDEVDGLLVLPADAPVGQSIREYLQLDDSLFTLKVTPNRADALSMRGIAREVAALTGAPLQAPACQPVAAVCESTLPVHIEAPQACGRYIGRVVRNVNAAASTPDWLRRRLERAGLRSISVIVDITNYLLLELGQPMHAFDLGKVEGGITVRMARPGEKLVCLNEKEVALEEDLLVIADDAKSLAIAGIMGGLESGVTPSSTDIFLESAFFHPEQIAGKARRLGFGSDSSYRYERGVDFTLQRDAIERATQLIVDICGGEPGPLTESVGRLPERPAVTVRIERINRVLGIRLAEEDVHAIFQRLGFEVVPIEGGFCVTPPAARYDIAIEEDLIEEVARVHGYDAIPSDAPVSRLRMLPLPEDRLPRSQLRRQIAARDYQEVVSYAFVDERWEQDFAANADPVRLINPIASQMSVMRSTLIGGLVSVLSANLNRKQPRVRIFEIARVFRKDEGMLVQPEKVAGLAWGSRWPEQWGVPQQKVDFYDVKADVESFLPQAEYRVAQHPAFHPGRCAEVVVAGRVVGVMGELHPQWVQAYDLPSAPVLFELDLQPVEACIPVKARPVSRFQGVRRDLALVVDESLPVQTVLVALQQAASSLVTEVAVFDVYRGKGVEEGKKSLAFRVQMQEMTRTLTDDEVEAEVKRLLDAAALKAGAVLR